MLLALVPLLTSCVHLPGEMPLDTADTDGWEGDYLHGDFHYLGDPGDEPWVPPEVVAGVM